MRLEVEQKFRVDSHAAVADSLARLGAGVGEPGVEVDTYFAHPSRDFAATDEALRLRSRGAEHIVTYKGPKLDLQTKTRREIEASLADDASAAKMREVLLALGFRPVADVRKTRRAAEVRMREAAIEVTLDEVDGVGTFVELEIQADERDADQAKAAIAELAAELGLVDIERRSYLELLLATRA